MKYGATAFLLAAAFLMPALHCVAYPIPPRSLRQLYEDAELIVVAYVQKTEIVERDDPWHIAKATLRIISCLKGAGQDVVVVYYNPHMVCPAPARFEEGTSVLAFLVPSEKEPGYRTCSLSYGAKMLTGEELKAYLARIEDLKTIVAIDDEDLRVQKTTEWLMKCVEEQATRWEGLLDLDRPSRTWLRERSSSEPEFWRHLTTEHAHQLLAILETAAPGKYGFPYEVSAIMSILTRRAGNEDLMGILEQYRKIEWRDEKRDKKQKALLAEFLMTYRNLPNIAIDSDKK